MTALGIAIAKPDFQAQHDKVRDQYAELLEEDLRLSAASYWLGAVNTKPKSSSVAARNFLVFDAVHLLKGDWSERKRELDAWEFTDILQLKADYQSLLDVKEPALPGAGFNAPSTWPNAPTWREVLNKLKQAVEHIESDTYPSFDAFANAPENQGLVLGQDLAAQLDAYNLWVRRFRSYLVLDIPWPELDWRELRNNRILTDRVAFFLARQDDEWGLRDYHDAQLWRHIRNVFDEVQSTAHVAQSAPVSAPAPAPAPTSVAS